MHTQRERAQLNCKIDSGPLYAIHPCFKCDTRTYYVYIYIIYDVYKCVFYTNMLRNEL